MLIKRPYYLNEVLKYQDTEFIKVITGVRRAGKSSVMEMYRQHLLENGTNPKHIMHLNFESFETSSLLCAEALIDYIRTNAESNVKMHFLFDEIQLVSDWERVINGLRVSFDADILVTGSNAKMLSSELSTLISGRFVTIEVYPLSFAEFLHFKQYDPSDVRQHATWFREYIRFGGFPAVVLAGEQIKESILNGIYDTVILNDVGFRSGIKEPEILKSVSRFLASNIGQITNPTKIKGTLESVAHQKTSVPTVTRYMDMLENAFLFYRANRYDIRGKAYLHGSGKWFIADTGLRNVALSKSNENIGSEIENVVYIELRRRGYTVSVGRLDRDEEIDFVARKLDKTLYVQVTEQVPSTSDRETANLLHIPDNHQKLLLMATPTYETEIEGVPVKNVFDWLLEAELY
jgi:predicted AAA+ superfamily ATPase